MKRIFGGLPFFSGIVRWIKRLFQKRKTDSSAPAIEQAGRSAEPSGINWAVKDVMVGTVRTEEQLHFNLIQCSYYVPARLVPDEYFPLRYIALHEEELIDESGIKRFGEVISVRKIKRGTIPVTMRPKANPDEVYYYFAVKEWVELPRSIAIQDTFRGKPQFTNKFLLDHCRKSYQLFVISSEEEYRLMSEIENMIGNSDAEPVADTAVYRVKGRTAITVTGGFLTAANENGEILERIAVSDYVRHPRAGFIRIKKVVLQRA